MKTKISLLILSISALLLVVSGCAPATTSQAPAAAPTSAPAELQAAPAAAQYTPRFINHPAPEFSSSIGAFTFGGCNAETGLCPPDSAIGQLGCQKVVARDLYGGLTPAVPSAWCIIETGQPANPQAFDYIDYPTPHYRGILIYHNNQYYIASNPGIVQDLYAPIETPDEALSYALLLTGYEPKYDQGIIAKAEYLTPVIEDTHVDKVANGFGLHLFVTEPTSDCEWTTSAVDVLVYPTGRWMDTNKSIQYIENRC